MTKLLILILLLMICISLSFTDIWNPIWVCKTHIFIFWNTCD